MFILVQLEMKIMKQYNLEMVMKCIKKLCLVFQKSFDNKNNIFFEFIYHCTFLLFFTFEKQLVFIIYLKMF